MKCKEPNIAMAISKKNSVGGPILLESKTYFKCYFYRNKVLTLQEYTKNEPE